MLEQNIEDVVIGYAERRGFERRKVHWIGRRGAPDSLFGDNRGEVRPFLIEFKQRGKSSRSDQLREHKRLRVWGFHVYVCDSIELGKTIIDSERSGSPQLSEPRD